MQNYQTETAANSPQTTNINQPLINATPLPAPDNPPWNWGMGLLVWFASVLFIVVIPSIAIIFYVISKGYPLGDSKQLAELVQNDPTAILVNILAVIPAHILTIAVAWAVVTNLKKFSFREMLGWKLGGFRVWYVIPIIICFYLLAFLLTQIFGDQDNELLKILRSSRTVVYAVAFMATFTAPLVEEVVYRGVLYSSFQKRFGVAKAVFLATALFALVHVPQYYPSAATIITICVLSLVLTLIRARTNNLLPCIILHTVFNGIQSLGLILEPYLDNLIKQTDPQAAFFHFFK